LALPFFDTTMIHLTPNAGNQTFSVSPYQQRKYLPMPGFTPIGTFVNYLIQFKEIATGKTWVVEPIVSTDNERETIMQVRTDSDFPLLGAAVIPNSGLYTYTIYANYFGDNLDVTDVLKIGGVLETGVARLAAEAAWTTPDISIPDNVVYYE